MNINVLSPSTAVRELTDWDHCVQNFSRSAGGTMELFQRIVAMTFGPKTDMFTTE